MSHSIKDVVGYLPCCESGECHRGCPDYEPPTSQELLEGLSWGANVYVQVLGQRLPWRFTKATMTGWKRTDGLARPNQWVDHEQLAALGEIVDPPWKEKPDDGQPNSA